MAETLNPEVLAEPVSIDDNATTVSVDDGGGSLTADVTGSVSLVPLTTGGINTFHLVSAASTNATNVKASAGQLYGFYLHNNNAAQRKVAFHNTAGTPTAGASIFFSIPLPGTSAMTCSFEQGITFGTGIAVTTVTGIADSDSTGVGV